jgi:hypothetical protein
MYLTLDVETKNLGARVGEENELLLSVQLGDDTKQSLFYYDAKDSTFSLESARKEIISFLAQGITFSGYNIDFDAAMLKRFLGLEIPKSQTFDLCHTPEIEKFHQTTKDWSLECACAKHSINASHKRRMNEKAQQHKSRPDIQEKTKANATNVIKTKPYLTFDWAYNKALDKIAFGHAIWEAYQEFVNNGGRKDTLFYEYAIGDIISEHQLLKKLLHH